jgi:MFS family permease
VSAPTGASPGPAEQADPGGAVTAPPPDTDRDPDRAVVTGEALLLLVARLVSVVGDQLARVALSVIVYGRTGSAATSALVYAVSYLPSIVGSATLAGLADRLPRRSVAVTCDLLRAALVLLAAVPGAPLPLLFVLVLAIALVDAPYQAARGALLRSVAGGDRSYGRVTSLDDGVQHIGQIAGFGVGGAVLAWLGLRTGLLVDAATFGASALLVLLGVRHRVAAVAPDPDAARAVGDRVRQALTDTRVGLAAVLAAPSRRAILLAWVGLAFVIAPEALAAPWAASLHRGTGTVGLLLAANPVGSVLGLLLVGRARVQADRRWMAGLALVSVAVLVPMLASPGLAVALLLLALSGFAASYDVLARIAFVVATPDEVRGRAFGVAASGLGTAQGVGVALAGVLGLLVTPPVAVGCAGLAGVVALLAVLRWTPPGPSPA